MKHQQLTRPGPAFCGPQEARGSNAAAAGSGGTGMVPGLFTPRAAAGCHTSQKLQDSLRSCLYTTPVSTHPFLQPRVGRGVLSAKQGQSLTPRAKRSALAPLRLCASDLTWTFHYVHALVPIQTSLSLCRCAALCRVHVS